ncbi:MAG: hypothetical protein R2744_11630 [Bacteroidales bacterium]
MFIESNKLWDVIMGEHDYLTLQKKFLDANLSFTLDKRSGLS